MTALAPMARGSTVRATIDYVAAEHGGALVDEILAALPRALQRRLRLSAPTADVAYADVLALWRAADRLLRDLDAHWMERSGAFSIESNGVQLYSGILRKRSPHEFLTQSVSLFQLFYSPGNMQVVEEGVGHAVLRLAGFDSGDRLFCRRQTGGLHRALALAGGGDPRVRHVRCAHDGDAFCEWELVWRAEAGESGGRREA